MLLEPKAPGSPQWGNAEGPSQVEVTQNRDCEENRPHPKGWAETYIYCTGESSKDATEPAAGKGRELREQATACVASTLATGVNRALYENSVRT